MMQLNSAVLLVALSLAVANARHLETEDKPERHNARHARNSGPWGYQYGWDRQSPPQPFGQYGPPQQNLLSNDVVYNVLKDISEIASYIRRQQTNTQPIIIGYPFVIPQYVSQCPPNNGTIDTNNRTPELEDPNMNWGPLKPTEDPFANRPPGAFADDDDDEPPRPISFETVPPPPGFTPSSNVLHTPGETIPRAPQASGSASTNTDVRAPTSCDLAILSCCHLASNRIAQCFRSTQCRTSSGIATMCSKENVGQVINRIQNFYRSV